MRLISLDEAAVAAGLRRGQGLAEARAIHPMLDVAEEDPVADKALLEAIADWCDRYTPLVAIDGENGLLLDITGCAHLFGGEEMLLNDMLLRLFQMGFNAKGAIAGWPGLSWGVCRFGRGGVVDDKDRLEAAASLPVASLRIASDAVAALQKFGLKKVGDLLSLPRAPLARRFGQQVLLRLDQMTGEVEEPISPRRPVPVLSSERRLLEPIRAEEEILHVAEQVACLLQPGLEARGVGGRLFELVLFRVDGRVFRIDAGASQPIQEPKRIAKLFSERLKAVHDEVDAGFGFEILRLNVLRHENFLSRQGDFEGRGQSDASLAEFVDRVSARLGRHMLQSFKLQESHIPERASVFLPASERVGELRKAEPDCEFYGGDRPLRLLKYPEQVEAVTAEVPDGPPFRFRWRRMVHEVLRAEGPERISSEWWMDNQDQTERDYYRLEVKTGQRLWVYRRGHYHEDLPPDWYVQGVFA
jgi:protein ImuB